MLIRRHTLDRIVVGDVDLAFRRFRRPTVKAGGTLTTAVGVLAIGAVDPVDDADVTDVDARRAGFPDRATLLADLPAPAPDRRLFRVELRYAGADPRIALRADDAPTPDDLAELARRLDRLDRRPAGPWTTAVLGLIQRHPGRRAPELAQIRGLETAPFKADVRKLKALGLTESLPVGYRLSPRGAAVLRCRTDKE